MMLFAFALELLMAVILGEELLYWALALWLFALWARRMVNQYLDDIAARNWGRAYFAKRY
jgi:hypothetical protein